MAMHTITLLLTALVNLTASAQPSVEPDGVAMKDGEKKKKVRERFEEFDTDHDGKITLDEFVAGRKDDKSIDAAKVFAAVDTDANGSLSPEEFKAEAKARNEQRKQGK
jgi:Ca2+-binding EF-hand superfamily protein